MENGFYFYFIISSNKLVEINRAAARQIAAALFKTYKYFSYVFCIVFVCYLYVKFSSETTNIKH